MKRGLTGQKLWIAKTLIAVCALVLVWPTLFAKAEGDEATIDLQANVGFQGMFKEGRWYPARLTLTNETDKALKGDIVLSYINANNGTTDAVVPVELPPGSPVDVTIGVPGVILNKDSNRIAFYEGGYQSGKKEITLEGRGYLDSRNTLSYMIGVVSRDPDTFNFMPQLNQRGYDINVTLLRPEELPDVSSLLDTFDTLVINDTSTSDWSQARVTAIRDWVTRGGTLVLSGGAGYEATAAAFEELSPIVPTGTVQLDSAASLIAATGEELTMPNGLTVSIGEARRGSAIAVEGDIPLAIIAEQGFGHVLYSAFDPSLEPMASWSGSAMLWAKLLSSSLTPLQQFNGGPNYNGYMDMQWQLNQILDYFPSIKKPSFFLMIVMLAIYILIIAPILYITLSKLDRREWAWWLIPALSIVMGITVFMIGAGDKRNVITHSIELVELSSDGHAVITGGTAVFTPTGGTVTADFDEAKPIRMIGSNDMSNGLNGNGYNQLTSGLSETKVRWKSVPYWSTRKLLFDRKVAASEETGTLDVEFHEDAGGTKLTVTNNTPVDLAHVHYLVQGQAVKIGDLLAGESGDIVQPAQSLGGFSYYNYGGSVFPYSNNAQHDEYQRERQLIESYFGRYNGTTFPVKPVVIGFSTDHESRYKVNGSGIQSDNLRMWIQELSALEQTGNRITVPPYAMMPIVLSTTFKNYSTYGDGSMQIGTGEMELEYMVPNGYNIAFDKIDVAFLNGNGGPGMTWSIWNSESERWDGLQIGQLGAPTIYLTSSQSIRMKLESTGEGMVTLPQVTLEGEVLQP
ncbi:DUF7408 domain-containing protein [Paenibacillus sp. strain BS8-2]